MLGSSARRTVVRGLDSRRSTAVDLETGAVVSADPYGADESDTATLKPSLETARETMTLARDESKADSSDDDDNVVRAPPVRFACCLEPARSAS